MGETRHTDGPAGDPRDRGGREPDRDRADGGGPRRDRDPDGRARSARPRDGLGRPLPYGAAGVERQPEGVVRSPEASVTEAQALLDAGRPFHAHEVFEDAWKSGPPAERTLWRGLAQLAVGLTHAARGNRTGGPRLLRRGAAALEEWTRSTDPHDPSGMDDGGPHAPYGVDDRGPHDPDGRDDRSPHDPDGRDDRSPHDPSGIDDRGPHDPDGINDRRPHAPYGMDLAALTAWARKLAADVEETDAAVDARTEAPRLR